MAEGPAPCPRCGHVDLTDLFGEDFQQRAARRRQRGLAVLVACCAALLPWIGYLAVSLPAHYESKQWRAAWVGFDVALLLTLAATAWYGWRRRQLMIPFAITAAALLLCDAWFDVTLSWGTDDFTAALATALLVELPLAALLLLRVRQILRVVLRVYWHLAHLPGEPPPLHRARLLTAVADPTEPAPIRGERRF
ncbi:hypothetical protein GCM10010441_41670 [Kitasatospora paracochleata]|uniref:Uncharacterized protein n=1 Tax=Kitasatospora paracochleata TaxID=58354 RepID=A0ABT1J4N5_9ACTN|nr:hypothetical protein [Kitasatospora paracochleata]MCP2312392.1 hypothetical protein [Kitasatospora paracochleata]